MKETADPWIRIGAIAGLMGAGFFSMMWIVAVIMDGHWVLGDQTLSELGGHRPGSIYFNSGAILEGVLSLIFAYGLWQSMKKSTMQRIGGLLLLCASCFLILIGVFPITTGLPHTIASYGFFGLALAATIILIRPLWNERGFGPITGTMTVIAVVVSLAFLVLTNVELTEAVSVICLLVWSSVLSVMMLRK